MSAETKRVAADDPRLTAYALGEMSAEEREAFEAVIDGDDDAHRELEAITAAAEALRTAIRRAPESLGEAQKAAIAEALEKRGTGAGSSGPSEKAPGEQGASKPDGAEVVPIAEAAKKRAARMRALWIAVPAVAAAAALLVIGPTGMRSMEPATENRAAAPATRSEEAAVAQKVSPAAPPPPAAAAPAPAAADGALDMGRAEKSVGGAAPARAKGKKAGKERNVAMDHDAPPPPGGPVVGEPTDAAPDENPFVQVAKDAKSTFSIDVDTASYAVVRRSIEQGTLPPPGVVRTEELINYFPYADPAPVDEAFGVTTAVASAPWAPDHRLLRIGLKGRDVPMNKRPPSNLVFLLDVSGSMTGPDRLGLVKQGLELLVRQLDERDSVSIVVYAGASGLVLPPTPGNDRRTILDALDRLQAGGSTNGGQGIQLAYAQAAASFVKGGANRVLLATDGDFNVGVAGKEALASLAQEKAKSGVFLTVLGFGQGNLRDGTLEQIADKGNGQYAYIDSLAEAKKVLVDQAAGTLMTIAKDVKVQMSFEPSAVESFRLIGYENRMLAHGDFTDDKKDAGDIGAGHTVTALYEIVPKTKGAPAGTKLANLALRFKMPDGATSRQIDFPVVDGGGDFASAPVDLRFGAAVAGFGMKLRGSKYLGDFGFTDAARIAEGALGDDVGGHRRGFIGVVQKAAVISRGGGL